MKRTVRALGTVVSVSYDAAAPFAELVDMMLAGYATSTEAATLAYELSSDRVVSAHLDRAVDDPIDVAPIFELDLYLQLVERAPLGWVLHAAALEVDGRVIVLAGPSGAGKTTLTLALATRGAKILTEEIVLIDRDLSVCGLARPIHLAGATAPSDWRHLAYRMRGATGIIESSIAAPPSYLTERRTLGALIRIDHGSELLPELALLPNPLPRLWDCTLRQDDDGLAVAVTVVNRIHPQQLTSNSVESAVRLLVSS